MEIFDKPGGCVPPVAMVPVDGGVGQHDPHPHPKTGRH
jgi:hypothetical protein